MSNKFSNLPKVDEIKEIELEVLEKESDAVIVRVGEWRMRVFFEKDFKGEVSRKVLVKYKGDILDPHSVKFEKLK